MEFKWKLGAGAAVAALLTACGPGGEAGEGEGGEATADNAAPVPMAMGGGEGGEGEGGEGEGGEGEGGEGEGGEGEGGEGEAGAVAEMDPQARAVADFLLIRGHTMAGEALYQAGEREMAKPHLRHPQMELYDEKMSDLQQYGAQSAAEAGDRIVELGEADADANAVSAAVDDTLRELDAAVENVGASVAQRAEALAAVLEAARVEYQIGVIDGVIDNAAEYQDSWGFIQATRLAFGRWRGDFEAVDAAAAEDFAAQLDALAEFHSDPVPSDNPPDVVEFRSGVTQAQLALLPFQS